MKTHACKLLCALGALVAITLDGCSPASSDTSDPRENLRHITLDHDDTEITENVRIAKGTYRVADANGDGVIHVSTDNITIDFDGATLLGAEDDVPDDELDGIGIAIENSRGVTIKNANVHRFKVAMLATSCENLTICGNDVSRTRRHHLRSTPEREDTSDWLWPHHNDDNEWMNYGAGIYLLNCRNSEIHGNTGHNAQNGIILARCDGCFVYDNDMSFNSGWGLGMWRSSHNEISGNRVDFCVRGYSHGVYARGQDSAGILVFEQCCDNVFAFNSATHGGDGFFLYAGHETTQRTGAGGCNHNLVYGNDFSYAVANGIEATFSDGNIFLENIMDGCDYGIWAGYSYNSLILLNRIGNSLTAGIAIEHGNHNIIEGNEFKHNARGIYLWWDEDRDFLDSPYGKRQNTDSEDYLISSNLFQENERALDITRTSDVSVEENQFFANPSLGVSTEEGASAGGVVLSSNVISAKLPDAPAGIDKEKIRHDKCKRPVVKARKDAFLPEDAPRGRQFMVVDEWGPYDFSDVRLIPRTVSASGEANVHIVGPAGGFRIESPPSGIAVEPQNGAIPGKLSIRVSAPAELSRPDKEMGVLKNFSLDLKISLEDGSEEKTLRVAGTLVHTTWLVRYFNWAKDPRDDPEAWKNLLSGDPVDTQKVESLDFTWGTEKPSPHAGSDHFGLEATTEIDFPDGTYQIRTVSDDGVRVLIDGRTVLENWTHHTPTEDTATVKLTAGPHRIVVEHMELDGWAQLLFSVRLED